jgi:trehalose 6-phosphate phosphatase
MSAIEPESFIAAGDPRLRPFLNAPESAGIFLDFDGTLSDIVFVPSRARPVRGAPGVLARLSERFRLVTIVSGRSAQELSDWLGPDVEIWGTHGAERALAGEVRLSPDAERFEPLMREVHEAAAGEMARLDLEGTVLEDKRVVIGLHFRAAVQREKARAALDRLAQGLADRYGLVRSGGRLAFELRPPIDLSKAHVVAARAEEEGLRAAAFGGDDVVDLPAFDALEGLAARGVATLRIGVHSEEAPRALMERSDIVVAGPGGMLDLLRVFAGLT